MQESEKQKKNDAGLLAFLMSVMKKSSELPEEVNSIAVAVKILAEEMTDLAMSVSRLTKTIYEHHIAITQLLATQEHIMRHLKSSAGSTAQFPDLPKDKPQKPN